MARHGCDRVLFGSSVPLGLLAPALRRAGARRVVALTHGHEVWWARTPGARQLLRRVGDSRDALTYVSEWCREHIEPALSPAARARMTRLSPGVDPDRFHPGCGGDAVRRRLGVSATAPVVVCTARMVRRKGQDSLVRAWPDVLRAHPDAVLLLVGDGPDRGRVERLVDEAGVRGSVVLTGSVPWQQVPAYTDAGDVFAMPCRTRLAGLEPEAWGIVLLEARRAVCRWSSATRGERRRRWRPRPRVRSGARRTGRSPRAWSAGSSEPAGTGGGRLAPWTWAGAWPRLARCLGEGPLRRVDRWSAGAAGGVAATDSHELSNIALVRAPSSVTEAMMTDRDERRRRGRTRRPTRRARHAGGAGLWVSSCCSEGEGEAVATSPVVATTVAPLRPGAGGWSAVLLKTPESLVPRG